MSASLLAVIIDCVDPARQAAFWADALSRNVTERNPDEFLVSDTKGVASPLYFMKVPEPRVGKNRFHWTW